MSKISSIRRSGERGTSSLNWWVNYCMWTSAVFAQPSDFLDPKVRTRKDVTGVDRWWAGVFEGDDSLCALSPPMKEGDVLDKLFVQFWTDAGFKMKLVYCKDRATVVGYHVACKDGSVDPTSEFCPELPRALCNSGVSTSNSIIAAAKVGDVKTVKEIAYASAIARAADFSGILPTVSKKYLNYAMSIGVETLHDDEASYRVYGEKGHETTEMLSLIAANNSNVSREKEMDTMKALRYTCTPEELEAFEAYPWSFDAMGFLEYGAFRQSLPSAWRVEV